MSFRRRTTTRTCSICRESGHNRRTCWMKNVTLPHGSQNINLNNIEMLPIIDSTPTIDTQNEDCPICMEKLTADKNICITNCGHKFCSQCLIRAARTKNSCPLCRQALTDHEVEPSHEFTRDEVYALIDDNDYYQETFEQLRDVFTNRVPDSMNIDMNTDDDDEPDITISTSIDV